MRTYYRQLATVSRALIGPVNNRGKAFFYFLLVNVNNVFHGASGGIRTPGLNIRSVPLYPAELPTHVLTPIQSFQNFQVW